MKQKTMHRTRPVSGAKDGLCRAAALCGLGALVYLTVEFSVSGLLRPALERIPPMGEQWIALAKTLLALSAPFLMVAGCAPGAPVGLKRPRRELLPALFVMFWFFTIAGNLLSAGLRLLLAEESAAGWAADIPAGLVWLRLALVPSLGEELLFRGLMQGYLRPWGSRAAVWGQAVLFALLHGDGPACLSALFSGLALGLCAEYSRSLWPGVVFHLYNNSLALLGWGESGPGWLQPVLLLIPPALMLAVWAVKPAKLPRLRPGPGAGALLRCPGYMLAVLVLTVQMLAATFT